MHSPSFGPTWIWARLHPADQRIVESRRAVEIETLRAQAEVEPLRALAAQLLDLERRGTGALEAYLRSVQMQLMTRAQRVFIETRS